MKGLNQTLNAYKIPASYRSYILDQFADCVDRSLLLSKQFNALLKKPEFNKKLLFRAFSDPDVFRRAALTGFFEADPTDIPPPTEKSELLKLKEKTYAIKKKQSPKLIEKYPLHRNTWHHLTKDLPATEKVGLNPFLEQNFVSVQTLLYHVGYEVRDVIAAYDTTFLPNLKRGDQTALDTFFNFLAYQIIFKSMSDIDNKELSIKLQLPPQTELIVYIDHNTFDLAYGHFNHRLYPNEPNLIKLLLESVHQRWQCNAFDYVTWQNFLSSVVEEDKAVRMLLHCLAEGIRHRYFYDRTKSYRIFKLHNLPLTNLLNGIEKGMSSKELYKAP